MSRTRIRASGSRPCPACERTKSCNWETGGLLFCFGLGDSVPPAGWVDVAGGREDENGSRHLKRDDGRAQSRPARTAVKRPKPAKPALPSKVFAAAEKGSKPTAKQRQQLADHLRLPVEATECVPFGWDGQAWTWPEVDAAGVVVGIPRRFPAKGRAMVPGSTRGLTVPAGWQDKVGPVLLVEGMSDMLATTHAGLSAVGRPNSTAGVGFLTELLTGRDVIVVGENDRKADDNGKEHWPGRDGAAKTARELAAAWGKSVRWTLPPAGSKDVRDWLTDSARGESSWPDRGAELLRHLEASAVTVEPPNPPPVPTAVAPKPPPRPPTAPPYQPFPVHALPARVQGFVQAVAASTNTDAAFTALPLLSLLGAAVGTTRAVMPRRTWKVFPTVWACCVGRSASGKSPPLAILNEAVHPLVDDLADENRAAADEHAEAKARHLADRSKKGTPPPPEPPAKRFRVGDTTVEALAVTLSHNPRGVWLVADELAGWFSSFTRYKGGKDGSDRPKWLSLFDGGFLKVDRRTGDPKHISVRNTLVFCH